MIGHYLLMPSHGKARCGIAKRMVEGADRTHGEQPTVATELNFAKTDTVVEKGVAIASSLPKRMGTRNDNVTLGHGAWF